EIERLKTSRLSAKPTTRTSSGLIRDTDLSLVILRASLGTTAQNDPSLDSLRFTLVDGPLRPLLPPLQPKSKSTQPLGPVNFDDLLLGARATLSHSLAWPLDLVLGQAELQTYSALFAYMIALRREHVRVLECWSSLSAAQRARRRWTGLGEGGAGRGRAGREDSAEMEARKRLLRCRWGVVREMVWFLDTLWGYIMMDVVDVQYRKLQSQLRPRRNHRNSSNTRAGTTRATSPTSTHFGPTSSNPNLYASTCPSLRASTHPSLHVSTHAGGPENSPDFLDFTTLRTLHATYLGNIISGSLLGHPGCAALFMSSPGATSSTLAPTQPSPNPNSSPLKSSPTMTENVSVGSSAHKIEKLVGQDNFTIWRTHMIDILVDFNYYDIVDGTLLTPTDKDELAKWKSTD
ncbi:hypothetical protein FRC06_009924, partial [Ceratobasidium sp. 370]